MIENIKGAIFDMDGTLIDSLMVWNITWNKFGQKYLNIENFSPAEEIDKAVRTMPTKEAMEYVYKTCGIGESGEELFDEAVRILKNFYANEVKLKDGVLEFLEFCLNKGIKMCIASATDINLIKIAVSHLKIDKYFSDILTCAGTGKGKDEPDIYLKAWESLGTKKEETCVFEDSLIAIQTASKIGMKTVGIYDKYNYGHDEMKKIATVYISEGETLKKLIGESSDEIKRVKN